MKMNANIAEAEAGLVPPELAYVAAAAVMATQVMVQPAMLNNMSFRRPILSTVAAPQRAKKNWKH